MIVDIDLSTITVLIIDDSRYARSFIKSALQSFGARQVVEAGDGPEGVEVLRDRKIDLVLVDYDMQPLDGIAFTRLIRAGEVPPCTDLPIIMVSGAADMDTVVLARNAGITEFLAKPVSAESLFRRVRSVLLNPRPFVRADAFVGPCRRTMDRPPPEGVNRRRAAPLLKPRPLIEIPPGIAQPMVRLAMDQSTQAARTGGERSSRRRFKAGETIFAEGDAGDEAYVIESGRVSIFKVVGDQKVVLGELIDNGVFGEMALIDDEPRMASAEALADTVCLVLPKAALKSQLNRTPDLVILVLETLLHDIRKMGRELAEARARVRARRG
ncbi:MAG: CheY-like [Rhodospirillaceae bacterium]|nr:MAG: CheY-like [Rhodospirillaceae bacterium]TNC96595.1 MAG: CheY-like receiver [Stygiobacter sp.]